MSRYVKLLMSATSILSFSTLLAQSNSYSLKVYSNFAYSNESKNEMFYKENLVKTFESQYDLGYFSPAFTFYKTSGSFHEIELARIKSTTEDYVVIRNDNFGVDYPEVAVSQTSQMIALRYEYAHKFELGSETSRFGMYLGLAGSPYFKKERILPKATDLFAESQSQLGLLVSLVPRLTYNLTQNWFFDLNIPISLVDIAGITNKSDNPRLEIEQRKISTSELSIFPNHLLVRFGVGVRI